MQITLKSVLKNSGIAFGILGIATVFCFLVQRISESDTHVPLLFVLAVTDGYVYGIVASIIAVFGVNYVFTFPYFKLNFAITGYPLTFVAMLAVACSVSALTTQIKKQEQMRLEVEREKMRANLLRAVSHDIRTPLTSIVGSASGIIDNYDALSKENILELLEDMKSEGQWLVRMVENLLSITRIGDGTARIHKEEELVEEVISGAVTKFRKRFPDIEVISKIPDDVLLVPMDAILIEQVIVNLLENCVLHADGMTKIWLIVTEDGDQVKFSVEDDGAAGLQLDPDAGALLKFLEDGLVDRFLVRGENDQTVPLSGREGGDILRVRAAAAGEQKQADEQQTAAAHNGHPS